MNASSCKAWSGRTAAVWGFLLCGSLLLGCRAAEPERPQPTTSTSAAPTAAPLSSAAVSEQPAAEPDADEDGIPDRCDACPNEPGVLWNELPVIDGCNTGSFHNLTRVPSVEVIEIAYAKSADEPAADTVAALAGTLSDKAISSVLVVAHATQDEPHADKLAHRRAAKLAELLAKKGVKAKIVPHGTVGPKRVVEVVVAGRNDREEVQWQDGVFRHVGTAAAQIRKDQATGKPSPCGREPNAPLPIGPR